MGAVHFSIDTRLVEHLKQLLPLTIFVETGTFHGDSVHAVRPFFDKLYSVEVVEERYRISSWRFETDDAVELHLESSDEFLRRLSSDLRDESVLYWLDAHACVAGDDTTVLEAQCPLLQELAAIGTLNPRSVVLIDDARYFLSSPPEPNDPSRWPRFDLVLEGLRTLSADHEITVSNDVIIFSPQVVGDQLRDYLRHHELDWLAVLQGAQDRERQLQEITRVLQESEADRSALAAAIQALREGLQLSEADLLVSEADRADRLEIIRKLQQQLQTSEADRAARLDVIHSLQEQLRASEVDRAAQLDAIHALQESLSAWESNRAAAVARKLSKNLMLFRARRN